MDLQETKVTATVIQGVVNSCWNRRMLLVKLDEKSGLHIVEGYFLIIPIVSYCLDLE